VNEQRLPASLLECFADEAVVGLEAGLRFLAPLTMRTGCTMLA
jgi:hypothetical protein